MQNSVSKNLLFFYVFIIVFITVFIFTVYIGNRTLNLIVSCNYYQKKFPVSNEG